MENKRKIMVRDLGNPKDVLKKNEAKQFIYPSRMILGTIAGQLSKIRMATNSNGDEVETLMGEFVGLSDDGTVIVFTTKGKDESGAEVDILTQLVSKQLTLPGAWAGLVTGPFKASDEIAVEFAIEVGVIRADNSLGWTWALNPIVPPTVADPVERLMGAVRLYRERVVAMEQDTDMGDTEDGGEPHSDDDHGGTPHDPDVTVNPLPVEAAGGRKKKAA